MNSDSGKIRSYRKFVKHLMNSLFIKCHNGKWYQNIYGVKMIQKPFKNDPKMPKWQMVVALDNTDFTASLFSIHRGKQ